MSKDKKNLNERLGNKIKNSSPNFLKQIFDKEDFLLDLNSIKKEFKNAIKICHNNILEISDFIDEKLEKIFKFQEELLNNYNNLNSRSQCFLEYPSFKNKTDEKIILYNIQIQEIYKEIHNIIFKYDKIYLDNFYYPDLIGEKEFRFKKFKEIIYFLLNNIDELNQFKNKQTLNLYEIGKKFEENIKFLIKQIEYAEKRMKAYTDNTKSDFEEILLIKSSENIKKIESLKIDNSEIYNKLIERTKKIAFVQEKIENIQKEIDNKLENNSKIFEQHINKIDLILSNFDNLNQEIESLKNKYNEINDSLNSLNKNKNNYSNNFKNINEDVINSIKFMIKEECELKNKNFENYFNELMIKNNNTIINKLEDKIYKFEEKINNIKKEINEKNKYSFSSIQFALNQIDNNLKEYKRNNNVLMSKFTSLQLSLDSKGINLLDLNTIKNDNKYFKTCINKFDKNLMNFSIGCKNLEENIEQINKKLDSLLGKKNDIKLSKEDDINKKFEKKIKNKTLLKHKNPNNISFNEKLLNKNLILKYNKSDTNLFKKKKTNSPKNSLLNSTQSFENKKSKIYSLKQIIDKMPKYIQQNLENEANSFFISDKKI